MGACKRYYGRRHFAPTNLAVVDTRMRPREPEPTFYRHVPEPEPATCATVPDGPPRQATFFDD